MFLLCRQYTNEIFWPFIWGREGSTIKNGIFSPFWTGYMKLDFFAFLGKFLYILVVLKEV